MLNILVVEDNYVQCKELVNFISQNIDDIKLYSMAFTGKEALNLIRTQKIDIILLDLKLPDIPGIDIINNIDKENLAQYEKSIIIVSSQISMLSKIRDNPYIYTYFYKPINFEKLIPSIEEIIFNKKHSSYEDIVIKKINSELKKLNFNFSYIGTKYLSECIYEIYLRKESNYSNLSKEIYPILAKRHHKSCNTIYGNIKQSVNAMYYDTNETTIKKYLNYSYFSKPKIKEIVFAILDKLE